MLVCLVFTFTFCFIFIAIHLYIKSFAKKFTETHNFVSMIVKTILLELESSLSLPFSEKNTMIRPLKFQLNFAINQCHFK